MIRYDRRAQALAIGLALLAGYVDAVGFLLSGGMFVSFMSGNSTRLGVWASWQMPLALIAAALIASFVTGVMAGSLLARVAAKRKAATLALATVLLAIAAGLAGAGLKFEALLVLATAMGCTNTVFQRDGEVTIGVTYMTGALVRLGQKLTDAMLGGRRWDWLPFLFLWCALVVGAAAGALSFAQSDSLSLWIGVGGAAAMTLWAARFSSAPADRSAD